jgi:hypothetical protein
MNDITRSNSVADLRERLKTEHAAVAGALKNSLSHAMGAGETGSLEQPANERKVEELFLSVLAIFERQGRNVSPHESPTLAPAAFVKHPEAKDAKVSKAALEAAMKWLFANGTIHLEHYGRPSRLYSKLTVTNKSV